MINKSNKGKFIINLKKKKFRKISHIIYSFLIDIRNFFLKLK